MCNLDASLVLVVAWLLDDRLREPPNVLHPVVWMGNAIAPLKRIAPRAPAVELVFGAVYALAITFGFAALGFGVLYLANQIHHWVAFAIQVFLLWSCFALKGLWDAAQEMASALATADMARARRALMSLCSRDPSELSASELSGATIESLSENLSDSVVAPLFYFAIFGVPGALFYRAANTLDAMVGYHGRYEYLGKAAARLDDVLNVIPARLTAVVLALAGLLLRMPVGRGVRVCLRDAQKTESPNAGRPMAMAAGLLGVRLDKRDAYVLGAELSAPGGESLPSAMALTQWAGTLFVMALLTLLTVCAGYV